jgi:hypothetical protein
MLWYAISFRTCQNDVLSVLPKGSQHDVERRTRCLKATISSSVRVSALAMTGIKLTLVCRRRMNSMSICFNLFTMHITLFHETRGKEAGVST